MRSPWLNIPLHDYEGHMSLPSIGQAKMLADHFELLIKRNSPASVAIIGCAGGNGLDRIAPGQVERVVAVDINPNYVEEARTRYASRLGCLEVICGDVQAESLHFEPVDLIYAALIFEYVDISSTFATLRRHCRSGGTLATLLQLPHANQNGVTPSPYESLQALAPILRLRTPAELQQFAAAAGFPTPESETIALPSGKEFCLQTFRS
jgi:cyclopropane fatty-acyl-phospholipid synthase-like methyltransferase